MLVEALMALAAAGGGAVVQAAGTDAWNGLRQRVGALFSQGDAAREQSELERLDRTAQALGPGGAADEAAERLREAGVWQGRFESLLEGLDGSDREHAAQELRALLTFVATATGDTALATGTAVAREGGTAVTGIKRSGTTPDRSARAINTGDAEATGTDSSAISGIVND